MSRICLILLSLALGSGTATAQIPRIQGDTKIRGTIDRLLREELTQGWYPRAVDAKSGGFHQNYARDWSERPDDDRFLVYQSRMTWTAAEFAEFDPGHKEDFERYARHGVKFLNEVMRDREHGGFFWSVAPDGKPPQRPGAEKHVYGISFALYAASRAYGVTHDPAALGVAGDAFLWLEAHAHDAEHLGYFEALTREGVPILARDDVQPLTQRVDRLGVYYGFKSMNSHIHLLEAVAEFYRIEPTAIVKTRLEELLAIVRDRIAVDPGALNLYLTRDWRATPAHDSFGHDVETAYLLVEAAAALGRSDDEPTWRMARKLIDHALEWGWDEEFGGFYDKGDVFAGRAFDLAKIWWTQAEGLNALLVMHEKYGAQTDRYARAFLKQWDFIEKHQLDPKYPGWFGEVARDGTLHNDAAKATPWKANYHTARAMMNVSRRLKSLEAGRPPR